MPNSRLCARISSWRRGVWPNFLCPNDVGIPVEHISKKKFWKTSSLTTVIELWKSSLYETISGHHELNVIEAYTGWNTGNLYLCQWERKSRVETGGFFIFQFLCSKRAITREVRVSAGCNWDQNSASYRRICWRKIGLLLSTPTLQAVSRNSN